MFEDKKENPFAENEIKEEEIQENNIENNQEENQTDGNIENKEEELKQQIEDINNKYIRLAADFDNYRKRQMQERENLIKYGAEESLKKIIPVLDTFDRAHNSIEKLDNIDAVKESYEVCFKQLNDVLAKMHLQKIEVQGKEFDPNIMEAVMQTPTDEYPVHTVIAELQPGYQLYDKVLRPAMVNVATEKTEEE